MGKSTSVAIIILLILLFIGCENSSNPLINQHNDISTLESNSKNALAKTGSGDGAVIIKYEDNYYTWFRDYDAGYTLFIGGDNRDILCNGSEGEVFDFRDLYLPNTDPDEPTRIIRKITGNNKTALVWRYEGETTRGCDYYENTEPIAIGTVKFRYVDNDLELWDSNRKNANAYHYKVNGTVYGPEGQAYKLNAFYHGVWKLPYDYDAVKRTVKIKLTKKGKK